MKSLINKAEMDIEVFHCILFQTEQILRVEMSSLQKQYYK